MGALQRVGVGAEHVRGNGAIENCVNEFFKVLAFGGSRF